MLIVIDGLDMAPFLADGGLEITRNDLDSKKTGRATMNGKMYRKRVAIKQKLQLTCRDDLTFEEAGMIMKTIEPEWVKVRVMIPGRGEVQAMFYSNNVPLICETMHKDGTSTWSGLRFPLIEE